MPSRKFRTYFTHVSLFLVTLATTTLAGAEWMSGKSVLFESGLNWREFWMGLQFSVPFLGVLTVHEFGHYFTGKFYHIRLTLPYYIPFWLGPGSIGTMGAFIRIKSPLRSRQEYFDVGIAGPLAGFVLAIGVIWYGFTHLPPPEHIFTIHPEYRQYGLEYAKYAYKDLDISFALGKNLLFRLFESYVVTDPARIPNAYEMAHYPFLFAGYLSLFFTALNLIPIGQLDGGHILFSLIGYRRHAIVSPILFAVFVFYAGLGVVAPHKDTVQLIVFDFPWYVGMPVYAFFLFLVFSRTTPDFRSTVLLSLSVFAAQYLLATIIPDIKGYSGWLVFSFILGRVLGIYHPPVLYNQPLSVGRQLVGWLSLLIFILCFSPEPFVLGGNG